MSDSNYRPRITAEITQESYNEITNILPRGWQRLLFQSIVDGVLDLYKRGGLNAISLCINKHIEVDRMIDLACQRKLESLSKQCRNQGFVILTIKNHQALLEESTELRRLLAGGVDNWEGYAK